MLEKCHSIGIIEKLTSRWTIDGLFLGSRRMGKCWGADYAETVLLSSAPPFASFICWSGQYLLGRKLVECLIMHMPCSQRVAMKTTSCVGAPLHSRVSNVIFFPRSRITVLNVELKDGWHTSVLSKPHGDDTDILYRQPPPCYSIFEFQCLLGIPKITRHLTSNLITYERFGTNVLYIFTIEPPAGVGRLYQVLNLSVEVRRA